MQFGKISFLICNCSHSALLSLLICNSLELQTAPTTTIGGGDGDDDFDDAGRELVGNDWVRSCLPSQLQAQVEVQLPAAGVQRERRPGATEQVLASRGLQAQHAGEESQ